MSVTVFDHKPSVGRKFLLAGRGGLNITHSEPIDQFLDRYGVHRFKLEPAIRAFPPGELQLWCKELGEEPFIGSSGRVFPASFKATPLLRAWLLRLAGQGVTFALRHTWTGWGGTPTKHNFSIADPAGHSKPLELTFDAAVFALGGASWPRVGSDGKWTAQFGAAGIEIADLAPSNCGVRIDWTVIYRDRFAGTPIKNVSVSANAGITATRGDIIVTDSGLEGGPMYAASASFGSTLATGQPTSAIVDLHPDLDLSRLAKRLERRRPKDSVSTWLRGAGLTPAAVGLLRESTGNDIPSEPDAVAALIKAVELPVTGLMPIDRAISTSGGIKFDQIDESFELLLRPGNFVAGEMLDWDAPTGGYLLQASLSTGVAAAFGVLNSLASSD